MLVARACGHQPAIPLVERYDHYERVTSAPLPYLFQRSPNGTPMVIGHQGARDAITRAAARAKLHDVNGQPLRLVPHDFRRLFATEAVNGGLPIHIAAKLLGHLDLNTTKGYVAVYPEQVVRHFQAHLARRRARRPSQEYREPTTQEWDGFQQHFRRRRMALGDCYRPYGTDCPHEHACVRCPMLRMDPDQLPRLLQIEHDTHRLTSRGNGKGRPREALGCLARAVQALERPWGWLAGGCHPNRDVVAAIATAGFRLLELDRFDFQIMPPLVRPHVLGVAQRPPSRLR
jgi:hypothetical protein